MEVEKIAGFNLNLSNTSFLVRVAIKNCNTYLNLGTKFGC